MVCRFHYAVKVTPSLGHQPRLRSYADCAAIMASRSSEIIIGEGSHVLKAREGKWDALRGVALKCLRFDGRVGAPTRPRRTPSWPKETQRNPCPLLLICGIVWNWMWE
jgi:hypothetical protein